jgi:hypothetical protein
LRSFDLSERRACKLLGVDRAAIGMSRDGIGTRSYVTSLVKLARQKRRYGYRRLQPVLERRGQAVNVIGFIGCMLSTGITVPAPSFCNSCEVSNSLLREVCREKSLDRR